MDNISDIKITNLEKSFYIKPVRMFFKQDGREKSWDLLKIHDSVAGVILNTSRNVLIFVQQFRPAVYYSKASTEIKDSNVTVDVKKYPPSLGLTIELCAGIVDKEASLVEIMKEEILEECGYDVPISAIEKVTSYRAGVGVSGSRQTLFYTEVTDDMKISKGGGNYDEGEYIDVIELTLPEAQQLIFDENASRPMSLLFALMWFFSQRGTNNKIMPKL